jgi:DNA mismatch repair protein MutL
MSRIRILSEQVANQIAAGEVVERPVGAVKELLENSLDAGATKVEIEYRNGGKSYIRVTDNGCGMLPDEVMLSLERHATSKIRNANDLDKVISFGFRGEALPSIASISKFTMRSRPHDKSEGTELLINGGKIVHQKTCGMPPGTQIESANLFFSLPARKKFLKTENTEAAHISRLCKLYAIAHPEVAFTVYSSQRKIFQSPACSDLQERISEVFGHEVSKDLIPLPVHENGGCRISGRVSPPGIGRPTRQDIVTVVNGRPVESRTLLFALTEAYHTLIQKGKYPAAFIFVEIDPDQIDVNIHPQKREIRFRSEGQVRRLLIESILKMAEMVHPANQRTEPLVNIENHRPSPSIPPNFISTNSGTSSIQQDRVVGKSTIPIIKPDSVDPALPMLQSPHANPWRLLARLKQNLALFETSSGLVILHLNAARERIRFEQILGCGDGGDSPSQQLLLPIPIQLDNLTTELLEQHRGILKAEGFSIEEFGRDFYRIEAIPPWLEPGAAENFLRLFLDSAREGGVRLRKPHLAHEAIAKLAAREVSHAEDPLADDELAELPARLLQCKQPLNCPQGKVTFFELTANELVKKFGRNIS